MIRDRKRHALLASTSLVAALAALVPAPRAVAQSVLPTQGSVASGAASINQSGAAMTVTQTTPRAVINWNSFSIGGGDSVTFVQPNAGAAALNRVTGATPSSIAGQLNANGQVFLVNPNGIAITRSGAVSVGGGFVGSTLGVTDDDFNNGRLNFVGGGASAPVSNSGTIVAAPGGFVGLLGGSVANSGTISAPLGKVALGSGEQATLDLSGDGFLQVALPTNATAADGKALVDVSGAIKAAGGRIAIKAATAANAVRNAINLSGFASARSARAVGGSIILDGGAGGGVTVSGKLDASARRGGGSIAVAGRSVALNGAKLAARSGAGKGGAVTVSGSQTVALSGASLDASGATGGGTIGIGGGPLAAATVTIDATSLLRADALQTGDGGSIVVRSTGATLAEGAFLARGGAASGDGGSVETSGQTLNVAGARIDTTAAHGSTGSWLLDPTDFTIAPSGGDITGATLSAELASTNITIKSSAGASGTAGDINFNDTVSWSSANTLTLDAYHSVYVNADVTVAGAGGVALIVGDTAQTGAGSTAGLVQFALTDSGPTASLSFTGTGGALSINGAGFTLLRTEADLSQLTATPGGNFALANDISLSQSYAGSVVPDFYGHLEGLGHTLQNLTVTQGAAGSNVGFFGILDAAGSGTPAAPPDGSSGLVSNLFISNASLSGGSAGNVGILAGESFGEVFNSGSSGSVTGTGSQVGGLIGANYGLASAGFSAASVTSTSSAGTSSVGGLVGLNDGGVINSFASGAVQGNSYVGGLVGQNNGYVNGGASGFVVGDASVGGVVGQNNLGDGDFTFQGVTYGADGAIEGAYGYGGVYGTTDAGGIVGLNAGTVTSSFFNGPVSGVTAIGGVVGENDGTATGDYAIGAVSGTTDVGGFAGVNGGAIVSSFAMGAVRGTTDVGGLVGLEGAIRRASSVTDSYSTGAVSGTTGVGGLIGALVGDVDDTITAAYWDTLTSGQTASAGGVGYTTAQLQGGTALPLGAAFAGGAAGGETGVYPYLTGFFPDGVHAISGFAFKDSGGADPLASGGTGAVTVYADVDSDGTHTVKQPGTTGANGYYYIFVDAANATAGANTVVYTTADATTGATNAATYFASAGANNTTGVDILGSTFTETTALPTYSQLVGAVADATQGDTAAPAALAGVSFIDIVSTGANFLIDQPISTTADLTVTGDTAIAANVTATGGVNFNSPVTLGANVIVDSGAAATTFAGSVDGTGTPGAGLTLNGPTALFGDVTTANGALTFNGAVTVNANVTINSGTATTTFGSTINSGVSPETTTSAAYNLTAEAGAFSFGGAIGGNYAFGAVSLTSAAAMTLPSINADTIFARTTAAGADLTLAAGTVLTASGTGTAVTLAAAGAFINDSGPGAIDLTGIDPPNWLIYSNNPSADVFGGLNSDDPAIWNTPYPAGDPPTNGNYYLFAYQPTVTFTSISDSKTYGQDATAKVALDYTVSGIEAGVAGAYLPDTAATAYSGTPSVTSTGSPPTAPVAGAPDAINVAQGTLAALDGYALAFVSTGQLAVNAEPITISAATNTKTYDATTGAAATPTLTSGTLYDPATLSETYAAPNAGTGLTLTPAIAFGAPGAASNYVVTLTPAATGIINPEPITVTATPNTKVFDGNTSAAALPLLTAGTLYDPATLSEHYAAPDPSDGVALIPAVGFTDPAAAGNYAVTLVPTGTTPPNTGVILPLYPPYFINYSPSIYVNARTDLGIPDGGSCGVDLQLPDPAKFADPAAAVTAISQAAEQYVERCRDASQEDIANILDRYADALEVAIQKMPPKLRQQLRGVPAMVRAAAVRARVAPTRAAAVRVLRQTVAEVHREISLVRADDPDSARIRNAVSLGVSGVLNTAAVALARAEGI